MSSRKLDVSGDVKEIKKCLIEISRKIDLLLYEKELTSLMKLAESSLKTLYDSEPDIYKVSDLKVKYK